MPHCKNFLLNQLDPAILERLQPHLALTELQQGQVLAEPYEPVEKVYFPHGGIISCVVELIGGGAIETGMIGNDGVFGAMQAFDEKISLNHVAMQVSATASVITSDLMCKAADELPPLRRLLIKYEQFFLAQVQQTAACNAAHHIRQRICRWLLRMGDLVGPELPLTQEFLAQMMGVRRTSVTDVAQDLQRTGMITYKRGHITIVDLQQIRQCACECNAEIRGHYQRLFNPDEASDSAEV